MPATRMFKNHVTGLFAEHNNGCNREKTGDMGQCTSIDDPQTLHTSDTEAAVQNRHRIIVSSDLCRTRRVVSPRLVLYVGSDLIVGLNPGSRMEFEIDMLRRLRVIDVTPGEFYTLHSGIQIVGIRVVVALFEIVKVDLRHPARIG